MVVIEMLMKVVIMMNIISIFWGVEEGKAICITCRNYDDVDLAWRKITGDMYHREQYCHCRRWTLLGQAHIAKDVFTILHTNNETALY